MRSLRQLGNPDGSPAKAGLMLFAFPNGNHGDKPTRSAVSDASGVAILPLQRDKECAISVALDRDHPNGSVANIRLGWTESDKLSYSLTSSRLEVEFFSDESDGFLDRTGT